MTELLVGGWFASPVIRRVVEKAQKYLSANYQLQNGSQEMIETLTRKLVLTQAVVKEVEKRTIINNPDLAIWLRILKETVYNAEDVLDNMEAKSIKEKTQRRNKVSKLASSSLSGLMHMFFPDDNYKKLEKVVNKLKQLSADITNFVSLVNMNQNYESHNLELGDQRETISQPLDVDLYGREDELDLILEIILGTESVSRKKTVQNYNNYQGIIVIPIVGIGGVGKTALTQAVYNNPEVQQTFASKSWISVSYNLDVIFLMRKIIQSLGGHLRLDVITLEDISNILCSIISGVKTLVVLDDMSEKVEYHWDYLYATLSRGAGAGSVVILTTQNQAFANRVGTFGPIALSALEPCIFWKLFKHIAFKDVVVPEEKRIILKSIGKKIAEKLRCLPLAAKIIGNILRTNVDEERWRKISKSEWWDIPEGKSRILASIGIGYENLDPCLRQCFAYCSVFPRNSLIEKDRVVQMWIAQSFIRSDVNGVMNLEDIGSHWFDELVEKSFFQSAVGNNSYVMHDLMHDLAVIVSSGECFYLGEGLVDIPLGVRHLAVDTNNLEVIEKIKTHTNLRSFLYFGCCQVEGMYNAINDTLSNLDSIRVLDLSYLPMEKESKPPPAIWNLQHLRFLDLSSTGIQILTNFSIGLYHLQALYIQKCPYLELPRGISKLINLRHLRADEDTINQIASIGQLTNLQELGAFVVGEKEGHKITELKNLREIRGELRIENFENIKNKDEAMQADLINKKHLHSICIYSKTIRRKSNVEMEVLEALQPHKDIKDLRIGSYIGSEFPNWVIQIGDFLNLNTVYLFSCVNIQVLPPLGELPSLKFLQIDNLGSIKRIDYHLYGKRQTVFPLLKELYLVTLPNCEEWTNARVREFFPRLSKLNIHNTKTMREAPLHFFSPSLKELMINECGSLFLLENSIRQLSSLTVFKLSNSFMSISFNPLCMLLLVDLMIENCSELKIEGDLRFLTHLKRLKLVGSPKLFSNYPTKDHKKGKGLQVHPDEGLKSLTHIEADHSLLHHDQYHLILGSLHSLRVLNFSNSEFTQFTDHQNLWFQELTTLQEIHFSNCEFKRLPASLNLLSSLKKMVLLSCTKLESLSDSLPPNLQELTLMGCSQSLAQRCQPNKGEDWQFLSSTPVIKIDGITIRKPQFPDATG